LGLAAVLVVPWHLYAWARFGRAFVEPFWLANVVGRTSQALHQASGPLFYVKMLWQHEKTLILLGTVGLLYTASNRDYLPLASTLGVLVPYSFVASRYDYYALLAYPPLALGAGQAAIDVARRVQRRFAAWLP